MSRIPARIAGAAAAVAMATAGVGAATLPAHADSSDPFPYRDGTVHANGGLNARITPSTHSATTSHFADGASVKIDCKVQGPNVNGNNLWYLIPGERAMWVSARYVSNDGPAPGYCNPSDGFFAGTTTAVLNQRAGASQADAKVGQYAKGAKVRIGCYTTNAKQQKWFHTDKSTWAAATYVQTNGDVRYCSMH